MNVAALRRIEAFESRLGPAQGIADADLPAAINARLAPHFGRGLTLADRGGPGNLDSRVSEDSARMGI